MDTEIRGAGLETLAGEGGKTEREKSGQVLTGKAPPETESSPGVDTHVRGSCPSQQKLCEEKKRRRFQLQREEQVDLRQTGWETDVLPALLTHGNHSLASENTSTASDGVHVMGLSLTCRVPLSPKRLFAHHVTNLTQK